MAQQGVCHDCKHLNPALDPFIQQAYIGQCMKIEWPYALNIAKTGVPAQCDYHEKK